MNSWVFRNLDELRRIYCGGRDGTGPDADRGLLHVAPAPLAEDGTLEVAGPTLYGDPTHGFGPRTSGWGGRGPGWDRGAGREGTTQA
ncbi:MAG: hypothetical protein VX460_02610 [Planctomycetota bacterium]|nr:hypothetical protein [Planctomycetota bacterium]